jgi:hypothetical protein
LTSGLRPISPVQIVRVRAQDEGGERAVDIVEVAAIAIAAGMRVDDLAHIALAYPSYAGLCFVLQSVRHTNST